MNDRGIERQEQRNERMEGEREQRKEGGEDIDRGRKRQRNEGMGRGNKEGTEGRTQREGRMMD